MVDYRKLVFFSLPTDIVVPVTLSDGTTGRLHARKVARRGTFGERIGVLVRRALRHPSTGRQKLVARGDAWVAVLPDGTRLGDEVFASLDEARVWAAALELGPEQGEPFPLYVATRALRAYRAEQALVRQREQQEREAAERAAAAALGLLPWCDAEPLYREAMQQLLRWTCGRNLRDCRDHVLLGSVMIARADFLANRDLFLAQHPHVDVLAAEGWRAPVSTAAASSGV